MEPEENQFAYKPIDKINRYTSAIFRVFPNDSKVHPYLQRHAEKTEGNSMILFLKKVEQFPSPETKIIELAGQSSPKSNYSIDHRSLTLNNQLTETEKQVFFDEEPQELLHPRANNAEQKDKCKESLNKPNNKRYLTKEINEDDFFNKINTDLNNDLNLDEFEIEDNDQLKTKNKMFATSNINHADIFDPISSNKNTIDYLSKEARDKAEEKLKCRSYNGTHKRQTTFNFPTFDKTLDKMSTSDAQYSENYFKSKGKISFLKTQRDKQIKLKSDIDAKRLMEDESKHGGSFEEKPLINFLYSKKDALTEQRNARRNHISQKGFDYTVNDAANQFYLNNKENIDMNQRDNKKYISKKKKMNNTNLIKLKDSCGSNSGKHTRTNSKSNCMQAPSSCSNIPVYKNNSKIRKNQSKKSSKSNHRKESKSSCSKERVNANEVSSKRYSDGLFKDTVFDSRDDSTSGINELNLLQELTNFTNMKMLKGKGKQNQHCIHFERIITN